MNMRMAVADDTLAGFAMTRGKIYGRQKSDITTGHETLYERSYY